MRPFSRSSPVPGRGQFPTEFEPFVIPHGIGGIESETSVRHRQHPPISQFVVDTVLCNYLLPRIYFLRAVPFPTQT